MATKNTQISLPDIYKDCQNMFISNNPTFFSLLQDTVDISEFIPLNFYTAFY